VTRPRLIALLVLLALIALFFLAGADDWLTLQTLKARQADFQAWFAAQPLVVAGGFFAGYVLMAALSLPGAALLTLLAGALFGLAQGVIIVSFASSFGAVLAFLVARWLARESVERRFARQLQRINDGIRREGAVYLFTLRLVPLFPFFVINLVMGLTRMRVGTFYWVSQLGMLPGTVVYVNAGRALGEVDAVGDVLSPTLVASFVLLGVFPLLARRVATWVERRRLTKRYPRPKGFDYDVVVIGAGSAGLVASYIASALQARVALVERERMGGDCLNTGCVPSKALIHAARLAQRVREAPARGIQVEAPRVDFSTVMAGVYQAVEAVAPHDSPERYRSLGVEVVEGTAHLQTPWEVRVGERVLTTRHVILATGARPRVPALPGLEAGVCLTTETLWRLERLPEHLLVLGGGPVGCELGQAFARLGSRVTLVQRAERLLPREDADVSEPLRKRLVAEGVEVHRQTRALRVERDSAMPNGRCLVVESGEGARQRLPFSDLLLAVGREANVAGLGLEALGIELDAGGTVAVDTTLRSLQPNIWACGDVASPHQFTHAGAHQAWHATINALFGEFRRFAVDDSNLPSLTFTEPEVGRVGLNEQEANARNVAFEVTRYAFGELDRAIVDGRTDGFIKVLTVPGKDRILGASVVGDAAGELLAEFTLAMTHGLGLGKLLGTIHAYPTYAEAARATAGVWRNAHKPQRLLDLLGRYFAWRRRGADRD